MGVWRGCRFGNNRGATSVGDMAVLYVTHDACLDHNAGGHHPECPERLTAIRDGMVRAGLEEALVEVTAREATRDEVTTVHSPAYFDALERFCRAGGGALDADTPVTGGSWEAALRAAGAGLDAADRLRAGEATAAFCAVRPPGHHALARQGMGFCMFNNIAVCAGSLAAAGERVLIVDWDAHHGNGTQASFYDDDRVGFVSLHQFPLYPMSGRLEETGQGRGHGLTANLPMPPRATGEHYLRAVDEVVAPMSERLAPTWVLISAGFDGHRADPLCGLGLSAGDFGLLATRVQELAPAARCIAFLEGGYDLHALAASAASCVASLAGERWVPEPPTSGGPGADIVELAGRQLARTT